jgi:ABC-type phosphate/phosphonate transport system substrate-binding protein
MLESEDSRKLADKIKKDEIQMGVFLGHEYAWARQSNPKLEPIVICVNREKTIKAFLVVRAGSSYKAPADLRDRTLALPKEAPEPCKLFLRRKCVPAGSTANRFFRKIVRSTDVEEALDDVVDGKAQAAVVDRLAWTSYRQNKPGAARRLRMLLESEPFPCAVIAVQKGRFSAAEVKRVRDWLVDARNTRRGKQLLEQVQMTSFEIMPAGYDRLLGNILAAYPPPKK